MNKNKNKLLYLFAGIFNVFNLAGSDAQNTDPNVVFTTPVRVKKNNKPSDHDMNQRHIQNINKIFKLLSLDVDILSLTDSDIDFINNLSEVNLQRLETQLNFIKNTPGRTKQGIARSLARAYKDFVSRSSPDTVLQNNQFYADYNLKTPVTKLINRSLSLLDSPDRRDLSAVNIPHIMDADIRRNDEGSIIKISGGHTKSSYIDHEGSFLGDSKGFLSPDGKTMGISFSDKIGKTIDNDLSPEKILSDLRQGLIIATHDDLQIRYISSGKFVGCYVDKGNPLQMKTQFPILTISHANMNRGGLLYVGNLVDFQSDGSLADDASEPNLYLTQSQFNGMMSDSSVLAFTSMKPGIIVKDLTGVLQQHFSKELNDFGMIKFPAPIYGVQGI